MSAISTRQWFARRSHDSPLGDLDLVVVENVGNLVCPAEFDIGEDVRAMIYSVTEGEEKPLKYPVMFRSADVVVINKIDLLPYLDFDLELFNTNLRNVHPGVHTIELSSKTGSGLDHWCAGVTAINGTPMSADRGNTPPTG